MVNRGTPAFAWHEGSPREDLGNIPEGAPAVRWKPWTSPLLLSGTRSLIIPWTVERASLDQDHHQWESTWFTWLREKRLLSHTRVLRNKHITRHRKGFLGGSVGKESACDAGDHLQCRRPDFDPWVGKIFWKGKWQPTPLFLPGKSYGQRNLVGDGP